MSADFEGPQAKGGDTASTSARRKYSQRNQRTREQSSPAVSDDMSWPDTDDASTRRLQRNRATKSKHNSTSPRDGLTESHASTLQRLPMETARWVLDVLLLALGNVKKPLSYIISIWVVLVALDAVRKGAANLATAALSPVCAIPGASWIVPSCPSWSPCTNPIIRSVAPFCSDSLRAPKTDFDIDGLMGAQEKLGGVLETKAEAVSLPYDMARSNAALRNLKGLINFTKLPSRQELVSKLEDYLDLADEVVDDFNAFSSKCSSLVEGVIILNRYTLDRVEQLAAREDRIQGSLALQLSTWVSHMLFPFSVDTTEEKIAARYMDHLSRAIEYVDEVMMMAISLNTKLQDGRGYLHDIQRLTTDESDKIKAEREDFLEYLWNVVTGVAPPGRVNAKQLPLLQSISSQRQFAAAKTEMVIQDLSVVRASLKELRRQMEMQGSHVGFSLRVHVATISAAAMNLEAVKIRVKAEEDERRQIARKNFGLNKHGMFIEAT
ncbi:hypothetical protein HJFPF1_07647 [Paramyrothecium foliicola]|nr:hypothetical protein HJFPF1_07647 [Paramyrothecium foliicola]